MDLFVSIDKKKNPGGSIMWSSVKSTGVGPDAGESLWGMNYKTKTIFLNNKIIFKKIARKCETFFC